MNNMNTLLRNIIASSAASVPVSLVSGQGLGQTAINALGTGLGAGVGHGLGGIMGGSNYGALAGAVGGNVLANVMGTDRNESNINALGKYGAFSDADSNGLNVVMDAQNLTMDQLLQMLPKSKQDEAMALVQNNMNAASDAYSQIVGSTEGLNEEEYAKANAIIQKIVASQPQAVVVAQ